MVDEPEPIPGQLRGKLADVALKRVRANVDERIKTEDEIDRIIRNHFQAVATIEVITNFRFGLEPRPARVHALRIRIDQMQLLAMIFQVITPAAESGAELEDRT